MKWSGKAGRASDVIDRRGGGGGRGRGVQAGGGLGLVGVIVVVLIQVLGGGSGVNFDVPSGFGAGAQATDGKPIPPGQDPDKDLRDFSSYVFSDVQDSWAKTFKAEGRTYDRAKLVLYSGTTDTGCGLGQAAAGPFYCPADQRVYLDLSFYREMEQQLGASGDFAWAYVIAHELGHHVQDQLGTEAKVTKLRREHPDQDNALSVRLELQADCYAGVWARNVFSQLEDGDLDEAFNAAEAVGDDRLQKEAGQRVNPDTFTHGTSAERKHWFQTGERHGEPADCDTFS